jgi:hypothetical protein
MAAALGLSAAAFVREVGLLHPPTPDTSTSPHIKVQYLPNPPSLLLYIPAVSCFLTTFQVEEIVRQETLGFLSFLSRKQQVWPLKQKQGAEREVNLVAVLVHKPCRQGHILPLRPRELTIGTQPVLAAALVCRPAWTPPRGKRRVVWNGG